LFLVVSGEVLVFTLQNWVPLPITQAYSNVFFFIGNATSGLASLTATFGAHLKKQNQLLYSLLCLASLPYTALGCQPTSCLQVVVARLPALLGV
jgi:hypothetical protein